MTRTAFESWMPFIGDDFYGSETVMLADEAAEAMYHRLLWHQWRNGGVPVEPDHIRAILPPKFCKRFAKTWAQIEKKFPIVDGRRQNPRCAAERTKAASLVERRKKNAESLNARRSGDGDRDDDRNDDRPDDRGGGRQMRASTSTSTRDLSERSASHSSADKPRDGEKPRSRAPRSDDQGLVLAHFEAAYQRAYGKPYPFDGGKDGANLKRIVERRASGSVTECRQRIDALFARAFWVEAGIDLGTVSAQWAKLVDPVEGSVSRASPAQRNNGTAVLSYLEELNNVPPRVRAEATP
jgi:hypothetical protein